MDPMNPNNNQHIENNLYNGQDNTTEDAKPRITIKTDIVTQVENKNKLKTIWKSIKDRSAVCINTVKTAFRSLCDRACKAIANVSSYMKPKSSSEDTNPVENTVEKTSFTTNVKDSLTKIYGAVTKKLISSRGVKEISHSNEEILKVNYETIDSLS